MTVHTDYLFFNTKQRQEFVRITDEVAAIVKASGVREGMVLVSAMHITGGEAGPQSLGTGLLRRIRRSAEETRCREGDGGIGLGE